MSGKLVECILISPQDPLNLMHNLDSPITLKPPHPEMKFWPDTNFG